MAKRDAPDTPPVAFPLDPHRFDICEETFKKAVRGIIDHARAGRRVPVMKGIKMLAMEMWKALL